MTAGDTENYMERQEGASRNDMQNLKHGTYTQQGEFKS
jgi:hypothetical protein